MKKALASTALAAILAAGVWSGIGDPAYSGGETRTLSLYHIHTGESITVTYKVDGKYVPSALKKINYLLRDWRRKETIVIDPKTIDLMWELHADLGSSRPIHIVCGYRSPKTNAFLKRVGRNVARKSQHMAGKAIDLYFPDVPTEKIRNSALVRQVGGVGYYRSSGGPTGFIHIDSAKVRYWGPKIGASQMAKIMRDYRNTVGARLTKNDMVAVADSNSPSQQEGAAAKLALNGKGKKKSFDETFTGYEEDSAEFNTLVKGASETPAAANEDGEAVETADASSEGVVKAYPVPKPRPKPDDILMIAAVTAAQEIVVPASATPDAQTWAANKPSPVQDNIGAVEGAETMAEESSANQEGKGSLETALIDGEDTGANIPMIRPLLASAGSADLFYSKQVISSDADKIIRRDGEPQPFTEAKLGLLPGIDEAQAETLAVHPLVIQASMVSSADAKDSRQQVQVVVRKNKGDLAVSSPSILSKIFTLGFLKNN